MQINVYNEWQQCRMCNSMPKGCEKDGMPKISVYVAAHPLIGLQLRCNIREFIKTF